MQEDRLVQIYIGDIAKSILIQQTRITKVADYFRAVFTNEGFEEAKKGVLHLPEDDVQAWELFMYWLDNGSIWKEAEILPLMRCWNLGDKYGVGQLQDDLMWAIFQNLDWEDEPMLNSIQEMFSANPPGCQMRKFLAEQVAMLMEDYPELYVDSRWNKLREDPHVCKELCAAMTAMNEKEGYPQGWKDRILPDGTPVWMRYMVGCGPNKEGDAVLQGYHWVKDGHSWLRLKPARPSHS